MSQFIVNTHGRLQEWIADAKGYFREEGLDYLLTQHQLLTKMSEDMTHLGVVPDNVMALIKRMNRAVTPRSVAPATGP